MRMMVGGAALVLFIIIWILMGDITLAIPCATLGAYLLVSSCMLVHRNFLCITGTVKEVVMTGIRKLPKYLLLETEEGIIRLPANRKPFPAGSSVTLYLATNTPVYEQDGILKIFSYLALELAAPSKKKIDERGKL
ncbi:hypothetical protein I5Q82_16360 [Acutalibacter muris]|uniref:Uncharacterized protein n=1 Tax=Acutalibacter muris TaxID=1796620 RepID=A0AA92L5Y3_9FIRM|nr:hypothetical protein [Acutalibacter muris]QQR29589.1 hypothetical protein I5Q82_16360 [Acutalibacter muris]